MHERKRSFEELDNVLDEILARHPDFLKQVEDTIQAIKEARGYQLEVKKNESSSNV